MSHMYDTHTAGKKILPTEVMQEAANALGAVNNDGLYNLTGSTYVIYFRTASNVYVINYSARVTAGSSSRATNYIDEATAIQAVLDAL